MAFKKGEKRPANAGRKKGTPNKSTTTLREALAAFDEGKGFDPIEEMLKLYCLIHADNPLVAVKILTHISDKINPNLKAIEHTGANGGPIQMSLAEMIVKANEEKK